MVPAGERPEERYGEAQYNLGVCYEVGQGVMVDLAAAVSWLGKAAAQGYPMAQFRLATLFASNDDLVPAFVWFTICGMTLQHDSAEETKALVQKSLEDVRNRMSVEEIEEAERSLKA